MHGVYSRAGQRRRRSKQIEQASRASKQKQAAKQSRNHESNQTGTAGTDDANRYLTRQRRVLNSRNSANETRKSDDRQDNEGRIRHESSHVLAGRSVLYSDSINDSSSRPTFVFLLQEFYQCEVGVQLLMN